MTDADEYPQLTDADKLGLRPGLARIHGALMRAWALGMFVPRDAEDERLVTRIQELLVMPDEPAEPGVATPLGLQVKDSRHGDADAAGPSRENLTPLTDDEYLAAFDELVVRFKALKSGYDSGMVVAKPPEQEQQLGDLRRLLNDWHRGGWSLPSWASSSDVTVLAPQPRKRQSRVQASPAEPQATPTAESAGESSSAGPPPRAGGASPERRRPQPRDRCRSPRGGADRALDAAHRGAHVVATKWTFYELRRSRLRYTAPAGDGRLADSYRDA